LITHISPTENAMFMFGENVEERANILGMKMGPDTTNTNSLSVRA
jgi:hypothetical protein